MTALALDELQEQSADAGATLARIERYVETVFCEPFNVGRVFGSAKLDALCQEVGRRNLQQLALGPAPAPDANVAVYIASKLQRSGGHTVALADVIRLSPRRRSVVLITDNCGRTSRAATEHRLAGLPDVQVEYVPAGGRAAKLDWIQRRLQALAPASVWLFNNHQDSVAVAAVQPDRGYQLHYYHHGDDRLCLGVCLGWGSHYDPLCMPFHNCRETVGVPDNQYLPLVATDLGPRPAGEPFMRSGLVTCTAAGFNKVEADYFVRYVDVVPRLLQQTGGRHVHIGKLSRLARWRLRAGMRRLGVPEDRLTYIPFVPSVWRALHEHHVDLYLTSFPYGGGRTLVEVMGAGVPAIVHRHVASRMIGGFDLAYDEALSWREEEELLAALRRVDPVFLARQSALARAWYEKYHRDAIVAAALADPRAAIVAPGPKPGYRSDPVLQAWQTAREMNFTGVLKRRLWRAWRHAKSVAGRAL